MEENAPMHIGRLPSPLTPAPQVGEVAAAVATLPKEMGHPILLTGDNSFAQASPTPSQRKTRSLGASLGLAIVAFGCGAGMWFLGDRIIGVGNALKDLGVGIKTTFTDTVDAKGNVVKSKVAQHFAEFGKEWAKAGQIKTPISKYVTYSTLLVFEFFHIVGALFAYPLKVTFGAIGVAFRVVTTLKPSTIQKEIKWGQDWGVKIAEYLWKGVKILGWLLREGTREIAERGVTLLSHATVDAATGAWKELKRLGNYWTKASYEDPFEKGEITRDTFVSKWAAVSQAGDEKLRAATGTAAKAKAWADMRANQAYVFLSSATRTIAAVALGLTIKVPMVAIGGALGAIFGKVSEEGKAYMQREARKASEWLWEGACIVGDWFGKLAGAFVETVLIDPFKLAWREAGRACAYFFGAGIEVTEKEQTVLTGFRAQWREVEANRLAKLSLGRSPVQANADAIISKAYIVGANVVRGLSGIVFGLTLKIPLALLSGVIGAFIGSFQEPTEKGLSGARAGKNQWQEGALEGLNIVWQGICNICNYLAETIGYATESLVVDSIKLAVTESAKALEYYFTRRGTERSAVDGATGLPIIQTVGVGPLMRQATIDAESEKAIARSKQESEWPAKAIKFVERTYIVISSGVRAISGLFIGQPLKILFAALVGTFAALGGRDVKDRARAATVRACDTLWNGLCEVADAISRRVGAFVANPFFVAGHALRDLAKLSVGKAPGEKTYSEQWKESSGIRPKIDIITRAVARSLLAFPYGLLIKYPFMMLAGALGAVIGRTHEMMDFHREAIDKSNILWAGLRAVGQFINNRIGAMITTLWDTAAMTLNEAAATLYHHFGPPVSLAARAREEFPQSGLKVTSTTPKGGLRQQWADAVGVEHAHVLVNNLARGVGAVALAVPKYLFVSVAAFFGAMIGASRGKEVAMDWANNASAAMWRGICAVGNFFKQAFIGTIERAVALGKLAIWDIVIRGAWKECNTFVQHYFTGKDAEASVLTRMFTRGWRKGMETFVTEIVRIPFGLFFRPLRYAFGAIGGIIGTIKGWEGEKEGFRIGVKVADDAWKAVRHFGNEFKKAIAGGVRALAEGIERFGRWVGAQVIDRAQAVRFVYRSLWEQGSTAVGKAIHAETMGMIGIDIGKTPAEYRAGLTWFGDKEGIGTLERWTNRVFKVPLAFAFAAIQTAFVGVVGGLAAVFAGRRTAEKTVKLVMDAGSSLWKGLASLGGRIRSIVAAITVDVIRSAMDEIKAFATKEKGFMWHLAGVKGWRQTIDLMVRHTVHLLSSFVATIIIKIPAIAMAGAVRAIGGRQEKEWARQWMRETSETIWSGFCTIARHIHDRVGALLTLPIDFFKDVYEDVRFSPVEEGLDPFAGAIRERSFAQQWSEARGIRAHIDVFVRNFVRTVTSIPLALGVKQPLVIAAGVIGSLVWAEEGKQAARQWMKDACKTVWAGIRDVAHWVHDRIGAVLTVPWDLAKDMWKDVTAGSNFLQQWRDARGIRQHVDVLARNFASGISSLVLAVAIKYPITVIAGVFAGLIGAERGKQEVREIVIDYLEGHWRSLQAFGRACSNRLGAVLTSPWDAAGVLFKSFTFRSHFRKPTQEELDQTAIAKWHNRQAGVRVGEKMDEGSLRAQLALAKGWDYKNIAINFIARSLGTVIFAAPKILFVFGAGLVGSVWNASKGKQEAMTWARNVSNRAWLGIRSCAHFIGSVVKEHTKAVLSHVLVDWWRKGIPKEIERFASHYKALHHKVWSPEVSRITTAGMIVAEPFRIMAGAVMHPLRYLLVGVTGALGALFAGKWGKEEGQIAGNRIGNIMWKGVCSLGAAIQEGLRDAGVWIAERVANRWNAVAELFSKDIPDVWLAAHKSQVSASMVRDDEQRMLTRANALCERYLFALGYRMQELIETRQHNTDDYRAVEELLKEVSTLSPQAAKRYIERLEKKLTIISEDGKEGSDEYRFTEQLIARVRALQSNAVGPSDSKAIYDHLRGIKKKVVDNNLQVILPVVQERLDRAQVAVAMKARWIPIIGIGGLQAALVTAVGAVGALIFGKTGKNLMVKGATLFMNMVYRLVSEIGSAINSRVFALTKLIDRAAVGLVDDIQSIPRDWRMTVHQISKTKGSGRRKVMYVAEVFGRLAALCYAVSKYACSAGFGIAGAILGGDRFADRGVALGRALAASTVHWVLAGIVQILFSHLILRGIRRAQGTTEKLHKLHTILDRKKMIQTDNMAATIYLEQYHPFAMQKIRNMSAAADRMSDKASAWWDKFVQGLENRAARLENELQPAD